MAHTKEYIDLKVFNCEKLIENASSQEQKEIYLGYLDFWGSFDKKKKSTQSTPTPVTESEETIGDIANQDLEFLPTIGELKIFKEIETEDADKFEIENAPKQAYYKRNGQWVKTKAFKEYLNNITQ